MDWGIPSSLSISFFLFLFSSSEHVKVADLGSWSGDVWVWQPNFFLDSPPSFVSVPLLDLHLVLRSVQPLLDQVYWYVWWRHKDGYFVKACYDVISLVGNLDQISSKLFKSLWRQKVPSKIALFCWRLILNRLPTIINLARRGILVCVHDLVFPLCFLFDEDLEHLFGGCVVSNLWWNIFCRWLHVDLVDFFRTIITRLQALEVSSFSLFNCDVSWLFGLAFCWII